MSLESQAADVGLPRAYDANVGGTGVYSRATSTTAQRYVIPPLWKGKIVEFLMRDQETQIVFGGADVVAGADADSAITGTTTQTMTPAATGAWPQLANTEKPYRVPDNDVITHFSIVAKGVGRFFARVAQNAG
jgi:hypothetical protein